MAPNMAPTNTAMGPLMATLLPNAPLPVALGFEALPERVPVPVPDLAVPVAPAPAVVVAELGKAVAAAAYRALEAKV